MQRLIEGTLRFRAEFANKLDPENGSSELRKPLAIFVACSDSRVVPELLTQVEPGNIFVIRNAGNIIPSYGPAFGGVSASIEYGIAALGIENLVVCGHSDCGAMKAILRHDSVERMPAVEAWVKHSAAAREIVDAALADADDMTRLNALVHENVTCQLRNLQTHPTVASRMAIGKLKLYGWVYNVESGNVDTYDIDTGSFVPLALGSTVHATPRTKLTYPLSNSSISKS